MDGAREAAYHHNLLPSSGTNIEVYKQVCSDAVQTGTPYLIFDFCGSESGTSRAEESTEIGVTTEVIDLLVVLDYVQDRPFVNKKCCISHGLLT